MANVKLKFIDQDKDTISSSVILDGELIKIAIEYEHLNEVFMIWLDKSTAIKYAKTLRTEINKIQDHE